jgi:hypothetical protein
VTSRARSIFSPGYVVYLALVVVLGGYFLFVAQRVGYAYQHLKGPRLGFRGRVHRADPVLGFAGIPGARGEHVFPIGPPLPMQYSVAEFRVPVSDPGGPPRKRPFVLALGCSFTYGDACVAEDTYAHHVAEALGGTALNAGKCAYGLAQMALLGRDLIPRYRPEIVLVQSSPWLAGRGTSGSARATFGQIPVPALTLPAGGGYGVMPPAWRTRVFDLPIEKYDGTPGGVADALSFTMRTGLPLFVGDDLRSLSSRVRRLVRPGAEADRQRAQQDQEELNRRVYADLAEVAHANGARMAIVRLDHPFATHYQQFKALWPRVLFVDAQAALDAEVPERTAEAYQKRFAHWRGDPPVLVDTHPNPAAHTLVAREVVRALRRSSPGPSR